MRAMRKSSLAVKQPSEAPSQHWEETASEIQTGKPPSTRRMRKLEPPQLSRRERRKIATREALLNAAQEVIALKGIYLAVIEDITERADVAKGSFYQYFRDREDLLQELLTRRLLEMRLRIAARLPPSRFSERVRMLIRHHLDYLLAHEDFLLFLHQIRGLIKMQEHTPPSIRDAYRDYLTFLSSWLEEPEDGKGEDSGKTREEGVCLLLGMLTGFLSHYVIFESLETLVKDSARLESSFTDVYLSFRQ